MISVSYPSGENAEIIEVEFVSLNGEIRSQNLLVDTGFTGKSCFVLSEHDRDLVRATLQPTEAVGALQGQQTRGWVTCRIPNLQFERTLIAIIADTSPLSLPSAVGGMAGLTFLRQFAAWGAENTESGWQFVLSQDSD